MFSRTCAAALRKTGIFLRLLRDRPDGKPESAGVPPASSERPFGNSRLPSRGAEWKRRWEYWSGGVMQRQEDCAIASLQDSGTPQPHFWTPLHSQKSFFD